MRERLEDSEDPPSVRRQLRSSMRQAVREIAKRMNQEAKFGVLAPLAARLSLQSNDLVILALLLSRHVAYNTPEMEGREILDLLFDSSYAKLQGIRFLDGKGEIRSTGLVEIDIPDKGSDPLDTRFRLSDKVVHLLCDAGIARYRESHSTGKRSYHNNREYLLDLKALNSLMRQRSARLFDPERFPFSETTQAEAENIEKRIYGVKKRIIETLESTVNIGQYPAVRFQTEFGLSEEEMLIVVRLLFQELLEGEAYADAVELVKMVSQDEEDLIRKRRLFRHGSNLLRNNIIQLEDMVAEKAMTAEVVLSNWVVERLLGDEKSERAIAPDEKIDFHNYLKNLDSAETFFRDLSRENES